MSSNSDIEWTDATWNPTRGCRKVSPGCKFCYAETFAERFRGVAGHPYEDGFDPRMVPDQLGLPLAWKKPRRVFVDSMSDLFMVDVPFAYIAGVFAIMAAARGHTFQVLTKRAKQVPEFFAWMERKGREYSNGVAGHAFDCLSAYKPDLAEAAWLSLSLSDRGIALRKAGANWPWPLPNVHLGVSVEDRPYGLPRIDALREAPAALRFLSIEPLLEDLGPLDLRGIGWVIVGGESGGRARECDVAAVRNVVQQCRAQRVPVFVKQLGRRPLLEGKRLRILTEAKKVDTKGKTLAAWPEDLQVREFPEVPRG